MSPTWLAASLYNVSLHVFGKHGRTLGVCEIQPCKGRFFFWFRWPETGGLCFRRAENVSKLNSEERAQIVASRDASSAVWQWRAVTEARSCEWRDAAARVVLSAGL